MSKMADLDIRTRRDTHPRRMFGDSRLAKDLEADRREIPTELDATLRVGHDLDSLDILDSRIPLATRLQEFNRRRAEHGAQGFCENCGIHGNFRASFDGISCAECGAEGYEADEESLREA
jgi:hypothetical protein